MLILLYLSQLFNFIEIISDSHIFLNNSLKIINLLMDSKNHEGNDVKINDIMEYNSIF